MAPIWLVLAVWWSPHRSDLAVFESYAAAIVVIAVGVITGTWNAGTRKTGGSAAETGEQLPGLPAPGSQIGGGLADAVSTSSADVVSLAAPLGPAGRYC